MTGMRGAFATIKHAALRVHHLDDEELAGVLIHGCLPQRGGGEMREAASERAVFRKPVYSACPLKPSVRPGRRQAIERRAERVAHADSRCRLSSGPYRTQSGGAKPYSGWVSTMSRSNVGAVAHSPAMSVRRSDSEIAFSRSPGRQGSFFGAAPGARFTSCS